MNLEYKEGLRLIIQNKSKGIITQIKKFHPNGELHIIIEWKNRFNRKFSKVQYTKKMLDECLSTGSISIDKGYYRDEKLKGLGL
jgi:hypothetical protein